MSPSAERCQSAAAQLKITGQRQQHLLTWIPDEDKQTMFPLSVLMTLDLKSVWFSQFTIVKLSRHDCLLKDV